MFEQARKDIANLIHPESQAEKNEVYRQRNYAVMMGLKALNEAGCEVGYKEADDATPEWVIVWAKIPQKHGPRQVAWHVPRETLAFQDFLEKNHIEYDGHTDMIKMARIIGYLGLD